MSSPMTKCFSTEDWMWSWEFANKYTIFQCIQYLTVRLAWFRYSHYSNMFQFNISSVCIHIQCQQQKWCIPQLSVWFHLQYNNLQTSRVFLSALRHKLKSPDTHKNSNQYQLSVNLWESVNSEVPVIPYFIGPLKQYSAETHRSMGDICVLVSVWHTMSCISMYFQIFVSISSLNYLLSCCIFFLNCPLLRSIVL